MNILRTSIDSSWKREKSISGKDGGTVWVGDYSRGISDVTFFPDETLEKFDVKLHWRTHGLLIGKIDLSPSEIEDIDPVRVRLSYQDAVLNNIDENHIKLYGFNELKSTWEPLESWVDKIQKRVVGFIKRPGCVALAVAN